VNFKVIPVLFTLAVVSISGVPLESAFANNVPTQTLFYTTFSGAPNVFSVNFSYDGIITASLGASTALCTTVGADGIAGNPQNSDLLLVGGQSNARISNCSISTGTVTFVNTATNVFHLEVTDATTVFGNGIPGPLVSHTVNPSGSLSAAQTYVISTDAACPNGDSIFTQIIDTPGPNGIDGDGDDITFYANNGIYGIITFTGVGTADTCRLHGVGGTVSASNLAGAHGGVYDPFTQNVITFGGDNLVQLDLAGNIVSSRIALAAGNFDQGTVDGNGHMYIAKNPNLYFLDYSGTSLIGAGGNFEQLTNLAEDLDDIAPLVGMGSTDTPIGGTILSINSASLLLAGLQSMTIWMAPILAGAAGIAAFYLKSRKN